jgi:hypothetical protein
MLATILVLQQMDMVACLVFNRRKSIIIVLFCYLFIYLCCIFLLCVAATNSINTNTDNNVFFGTKTTGLGSRKKTILSSSQCYLPSSLLQAFMSNKKNLYSVNTQKILQKSLDCPQIWATLHYNNRNNNNNNPQRPVAIVLFQKLSQNNTPNDTTFNSTSTAVDEWGCISLSSQNKNNNNQLVVQQIPNWTIPSTTETEGKKDDYLLPIEGIYGVFYLPSGPCLAVILESEAVYNSPPPAALINTSTSSSSRLPPPFLELRRVIRMDIIPIPFHNKKIDVDDSSKYFNFFSQQKQQQQRKEELRQIKLLRKALRSHTLYYIPPRITPNSSEYRIRDVTHTLQRSIVSAALSSTTANSTTTNSNINNNNVLLQPDARFFWNQELVRPLLHSATTMQHQATTCNESVTSSITEILVSSDNSLFNLTTNTSSTNNTTMLIKPNNNNANSICCMNEDKNILTRSIPSYSTEQLLKRWIIPCTSAFVGVSQNIPLTIPSTTAKTSGVSNDKNSSSSSTGSSSRNDHDTTHYCYYDEILISRRSRFRAGTRFTRRGTDKTGSVANFAETEQIILVKEQQQPRKQGNNDDDASPNVSLKEVYSFVQTRGSIPLIWSSPAKVQEYAPRVQIATNPLDQARSLRAHVLEQIRLYTLSPITTTAKDSSNSHYEQVKHLPPLAANKRYMYNFKEVTDKIPQKLIFVNLIDKKKDQGRLGKAFDSVLQAVLDIHGDGNTDHTSELLPSEATTDEDFNGKTSSYTTTTTPTIPRGSVSHVWYDFHAECKGGKWSKLKALLDMVSPDLDSHRYFSASPTVKNNTSLISWKIATLQTGIVRTNCMDCLDRTNVVQTMFARYVLFRQLQSRDAAAAAPAAAGADSESSLTPTTNKVGRRNVPLEWVVAYKSNTLQLPFVEGEMAHRFLWADNADAISRLYAGTPALKGDYTRTGRRTKRGALDDGMNSLTRYYINNFSDADRQEGIDLMTCTVPFSNTDESTIGSTNNDWLLSIRAQTHKNVELGYSTSSRISNTIDDDRFNLRRLLFGEALKKARMDLSSSLNGDNVFSSVDRRTSSNLPWWIDFNIKNDLATFPSRNKKSIPQRQPKEIIKARKKFQSNQHTLEIAALLGLVDWFYPELITSLASILCVAFLLI